MTEVTALKVGLIGAGGVVSTLHAPLLRQFADVSIEWVYDIKPEAARRVADGFRIPSAQTDLARCSDVDAVLIAIPVGVRDQVWRMAAERRWHVLCEKPAARTVRELDAILEPMQAAARVVSFGFMRRFYQGTLSLRQLIAGRVFGDPIEIWAGEGGVQPRTGRSSDWYQLDRRLAGGGVLMETGSHLLDQIMFVTGASAARVDEYTQRSYRDELEFDARVCGRLSRGASSQVPFSCVVTRAAEVCNGLFVRYPRIVLALPPGPGAAVELRNVRNRPVDRLQGAASGATTSFQAFRDEWVAFLDRCRGARRPQPTDDNRLTRLSVGVIEECYGRALSATSAPTAADAASSTS